MHGPPARLRLENLRDPLGLDEPTPRFSWWSGDTRPAARQLAYQVQVFGSDSNASKELPDAWDSGKVKSDRSIHVAYEGKALRPCHRYEWRVRTWDGGDRPSPWSAIAAWETGLHVDASGLRHRLSNATWIGGDEAGDREQGAAPPQLRREFEVLASLRLARLYITAKGLYDATINGKPVTDEALNPGWTDYCRRVVYRAYDVTDMIRVGRNAIGVSLGDGWYCGHVGWFGRQKYGDRPCFAAVLRIISVSGHIQTLTTDKTWRYAAGHVASADLYMGEHHDARRDTPGWTRPGFTDDRWAPVRVFEASDATVEAATSPAIRPIDELKPIADPTVIDEGGGVLASIFDLGQNMVGRVRLRLRGKTGQTVRVRYAEMLQPDGRLYTSNLRKAKATDSYTFAADGDAVFEPRFTFHGFRYVEVSGSEPIARGDVIGVVLSSDLEPTGRFKCSHPGINQLQSNIRWGQIGNFLDVPTDCPQRDERLGWTGDAQVFVRTAAFNYQVAPFFAKWQRDLADAQQANGSIPSFAPMPATCDDWPYACRTDGGPAWSDAHVICPWTMYRCYGDTRILETHYDSLCRFMNFLAESARDHIRPPLDREGWHSYGDWLAIDAVSPGHAPTPHDLIGTAYYARDAALMGKIAAALDRSRDAECFAALRREIVEAFNRAFVTPAGRLVGDTQTGYLLALGFDLLHGDKRDQAANQLKYLIESRGPALTTGFVGTPLLCPVLSSLGEHDLAYRLLLREDYPGWLYSIAQGATTLWERWNSYTHADGFGPVDMNSFNHYAYGAIGQWLYATVAGIDLDQTVPAFKRVVIAPQPHVRLTQATGSLDSPYGRISTDWAWRQGRFDLSVAIPPNTTAEVRLPEGTRHEISAGDHDFEADLPGPYLRPDPG